MTHKTSPAFVTRPQGPQDGRREASTPIEPQANPQAAPATGSSRGERAAGAVVLIAGLTCFAVGVTVMAAWYARATVVLTWPGGDTPMVFTTALAFTVTGAAFISLSLGWRRVAAVAAGLDVALGTFVLAGHVQGGGLGLDELFVTAYLSSPTGIAGRMTVNTAVCFVFVGMGLLAVGPWWPWPRRRAVAAASAASLITSIATLSLFSYASGLSDTYRWIDDLSMAVLAGATMFAVAAGMLALTWQRTDRRGQWLAMPAAAMTLGAVILVWLVFTDKEGEAVRIDESSAVFAVTFLGVFTAVLVAFAVSMGLRAEHARGVAAASESRLFHFLDALPVGVFITSKGGAPYYANTVAERLLGRGVPRRGVHPEVVRAELGEFYQARVAGTEHFYPAQEMVGPMCLGGEQVHFDSIEIRQPDGAVTAVEVWGTPIYGAAGTVDYAIAAFTDISDRQAAQRALLDQASLLDLAYDAILVWDTHYLLTYWNHGAERTYGFTRSEAIGRVVFELLQTEYPVPRSDIEAEIDAAGSWQGEVVQTGSNGQRIVLASRWAGRRAPNGTTIATMAVNRDITDAKNAEDYARSLLEASLDPLLTISPAGNITDVNAATILATGARRDLLVGTDFADHFTEPERARAAYREVFASGSIVDYPLVIGGNDGVLTDVLLNASLYRDGAGTVLGVVATAHDITDRKHAEQERLHRAAELEQTNIALAHSNAELAQFAYIASHDLSEPLRAISGPISLVARRYQGKLDPQADEFIGFAVDGCRRMQSLIDGLLEFSRVGRLENDFSPTDTAAIVQGVLTALRTTLDESNACVTVDALPVVLADPNQLTQVFQNLITNAVKFTKPDVAAHISVSAERDGKQWRFSVTDDGIGIAPQHRERIFGMFKRLHGRDEYPGTGIGLALVKKIVERHGGQIGVENAPTGTGTRFWFTLPSTGDTQP